MPTYEYACKNCGETIEVFQSFADKPLKKHKECGGQLQKVFHARGIVFKGGGFYATDGKAASKGSSSESSPDSKSSDSKSSDSKSSDPRSSDSKSSDSRSSKNSDSRSSTKSEKAAATTSSESED